VGAQLSGPEGPRGRTGETGARGKQGETGPAGKQGRVVYSHGPIIRSLLIAYLICFIANIGGLYWQWTDIQRQCQDSQLNRQALRDGVTRSLSNLGYAWNEERQVAEFVGPPPQKYWRENPGEIPTQIELIRQQLDGFPPIEC